MVRNPLIHVRHLAFETTWLAPPDSRELHALRIVLPETVLLAAEGIEQLCRRPINPSDHHRSGKVSRFSRYRPVSMGRESHNIRSIIPYCFDRTFPTQTGMAAGAGNWLVTVSACSWHLVFPLKTTCLNM
jgi:hypothetical protein